MVTVPWQPFVLWEVSLAQFPTVADWLTSKSHPLCHSLVLGQWSISHLTSMHYPFLNWLRLSIEKLWELAQFIKHISFSRNFHFGSIWWS